MPGKSLRRALPPVHPRMNRGCTGFFPTAEVPSLIQHRTVPALRWWHAWPRGIRDRQWSGSWRTGRGTFTIHLEADEILPGTVAEMFLDALLVHGDQEHGFWHTGEVHLPRAQLLKWLALFGREYNYRQLNHAIRTCCTTIMTVSHSTMVMKEPLLEQTTTCHFRFHPFLIQDQRGKQGIPVDLWAFRHRLTRWLARNLPWLDLIRVGKVTQIWRIENLPYGRRCLHRALNELRKQYWIQEFREWPICSLKKRDWEIVVS